MPTIITAIILGLVEGATEFLPVSSTGHLILAGHALGFVGPRADAFEIIIQLGAILAVVWLYRGLLWRVVRDGLAVAESRRFILALFVAFLPAAIVGLLTHHWIIAHLFTPAVVIAALILGGVAIIAIERWRPAPRIETVMQIGYWIGIAQVFSLVPGVSRSGATIMGALLAGVGRPAAAEFSFLLAIPVMFAATGLNLWENRRLLSGSDALIFAVGFVVSFASALVVVRWLIRFVSHRSFDLFAWYGPGDAPRHRPVLDRITEVGLTKKDEPPSSEGGP
ncbi:MAG: undecaprenyl-diphosphate phosphatase [Gemmatimonadetes bacterium]|nr:MAG: undecaprenyl-diphosphate phosphatase [Gemmatimonadota bacterium]